MARHNDMLRWLAVLSVGVLACNAAHADRIAPPPRHAQPITQSAQESPYQIELIGENGLSLDTYQHRGRFYVLGDAGDRYSIRVSNPTSQRVEAVISVDGLDVIDGKAADLRKRGYVIPAYGDLRVDGFRVSTREVATFRFSSVRNSYAGRKGKARNVGVIGVAIFEERRAPEVIMANPARPIDRRRAGAERRKSRDLGPADELEMDEAPMDDSRLSGTVGGDSIKPTPPPSAQGGATRAPRGRSVGKAAAKRAPRSEASRSSRCCGARPKQRPGLGTEFGERRQSAATWTRFVRANTSVPSAIAELRYNNASGLQALGIRLEVVDDDEIATRETANPFPGSPFAQPPQ